MKLKQPKAIVLMGVSGCGKTTVGKVLSETLNWPLFDGDDFHPVENVAKMSAGIPLDDDDRFPWLVKLNHLIAENLAEDRSIILACSALKARYRELIAQGNPGVVFVYLKGDFDLIFERMQARDAHYMKAGMLKSQFTDLEEPQNAITINISESPEKISQLIVGNLDM